jgi:hypothetical protein
MRKEGNRVEFLEEEGKLTGRRLKNNVRNAFGLVKGDRTVSLEAMEAVVRRRGTR